MRLTIHRGTNEIGASCVCVEHEGTRILLDAGAELEGASAVVPPDAGACAGFFVSHAHQDHSGLVEQLPEKVPLYMGEVAWGFTQGLRLFTGRGLLERSHRALEAGQGIEVGGLRVTPFLVDHSAPEAFAFLVEAGEKRLFYSGDFRLHGRKAGTMQRLVDSLAGSLDAAIVEGTLVHRDNARFADEAAVEEGMVEVLTRCRDELACLCCSAQHVDRMVGAYKAAKRSGRILVLDIYSAWMLRIAQRLSTRIPDLSWQGVRVLSRGAEASRQYGVVKRHRAFFGPFATELYAAKNALRAEDILAEPGAYLVKLADRELERLLDASQGPATVIWSQWSGYLHPDTPCYNARADGLRQREGVRFESVHTSGHAPLDDLLASVRALDPGMVIPIHSPDKHAYARRLPNARILEDGESLEL